MRKQSGLKLNVGVGFFEQSHPHRDGDGKMSDLTVTEIAIINEYGDGHTPARPFMAQTWERYKNETANKISGLVKMLMDGQLSRIAYVARIGAYYRGKIQRTIVDGDFLPNAPSTIRKKKSTKPLIDTGEMRQSVEFKEV
jgi:hypothetical protein